MCIHVVRILAMFKICMKKKYFPLIFVKALKQSEW